MANAAREELSGIQEERIKVCVRKRPLFRKEAERGDIDVIVSDDAQHMQVKLATELLCLQASTSCVMRFASACSCSLQHFVGASMRVSARARVCC